MDIHLYRTAREEGKQVAAAIVIVVAPSFLSLQVGCLPFRTS